MHLKKLLIFAALSAIGYFAVLRVAKDEIRSSLPVPMKVEHLAYGAESIHFRTSDRLLIAASYAPSRNGATVILLHGSYGSRKQVEQVGKFLVDNGFGVLSYDTRGHGESEGDIVGNGERETLDLRAALDYLVSRGVDEGKIGAYGFSMGAMILSRAAAHDERLKAIVLASVPTTVQDLAMDYDGGGASGFITGHVRLIVDEIIGVPAFGVGTLNTIQYISPRPILILAGDKDRTVSLDRVKQVFAAAKEPKQLVVFSGADHGTYTEEDKDRFENIILDFFLDALHVKPKKSASRS